MAMETQLRAGLLGPRHSELANPLSLLLLSTGRRSLLYPHCPAKKPLSISVPRSSLPVGEDVMQTFLKERQSCGDFISKASDIIWRRNSLKLTDIETSSAHENTQQQEDVVENEANAGFLKFSTTRDWVSGDSNPPVNKKLVAKDWVNESKKRKRLNLLKYEALKSELLLLTVGIGAACSVYCLLNFSLEAAISYASGVVFSCLYLQLLYWHTDNLSKEAIPNIFMQKKLKKIGIRSEDLKNFAEKIVGGTTMALSSPRLVIPATIYGFWALSRHFQSNLFDYQLVPGMMGFFAYKAAALVQVYRDNEDLQMIFPENEGSDGS